MSTTWANRQISPHVQKRPLTKSLRREYPEEAFPKPYSAPFVARQTLPEHRYSSSIVRISGTDCLFALCLDAGDWVSRRPLPANRMSVKSTRNVSTDCREDSLVLSDVAERHFRLFIPSTTNAASQFCVFVAVGVEFLIAESLAVAL